MTEIKAAGQLLTASVEDRTLTYRLLPFGEAGSTNVGKVIASKGSVAIPTDVASLELNEEHDYRQQIGKFTRVEETENGLEATVRIVATSRGNDALTLAAEGLRTGISVEISEPVIRDGHLIAGRLTGAGLVVRPAFANARLTAADCGEITPEKETTMETNSEKVEAVEVSTPVQAAPIFAATDKKDLGAITADAYAHGGAVSLQAALADLVTTDDVGKAYIKDQEVGQLWEAQKTERPLVNAVGVKPLESLFVTGTKRTRTFAVADWAGNKVELPTGKFTTSREAWQASRKAAAVDIAMELIEFGGPQVVSDLYEDAMNSYVTQSEEELTEFLLAEATQVTAALTPIEAVNRAASTLGGIGARMSFVVCSPDVFAELQAINSADAPWWLAQQSSLDIAGGTVNVGGITLTSNSGLPNNTILVGDSRAVDYRETPAFRYEARDIAHGGLDISFVKIKAQYVTDNGAILAFTAVGDLVDA